MVLDEGRAIPIDRDELRRITNAVCDKVVSLLKSIPEDDRGMTIRQWLDSRTHFPAVVKRFSGELHNATNYSYKTVDGRNAGIIIKVGFSDRDAIDQFVNRGTLGTTNITEPGSKRVPDTPWTLNVYLTTQSSADVYIHNREMLYRDVEPTIAHELTHAMDYLIPGRNSAKGESEKALTNDRDSVYTNLPHEVRAFARAVVDDVRKEFRGHFFSLKTEYEDPKEATRIFSKMRSRQRIQYYLQESLTWFRLSKHWTPENKRKVYQMIAREVDAAYDELVVPYLASLNTP
jgi:hypothetical protein